LTPCSARDPAGLVSYRLRSWGFPFRGLSLPGAGMPLGFPAPPGVVVDGRTRRSSESGSDCASPWRSFRSEERGSRHARTRPKPGAPSGVWSSSWKSVLRSAGVGRWTEPILSWVFTAFRVFPLPAFVRPMSHNPLAHFVDDMPKQVSNCASEFRSAGRLAGLSRDCRPSWSFRPRPGNRHPLRIPWANP